MGVQVRCVRLCGGGGLKVRRVRVDDGGGCRGGDGGGCGGEVCEGWFVVVAGLTLAVHG